MTSIRSNPQSDRSFLSAKSRRFRVFCLVGFTALTVGVFSRPQPVRAEDPAPTASGAASGHADAPAPVPAEKASGSPTQPGAEAAAKSALAVFAGGCFWCMEPPFDALEGVLETTSGYIGGHKKNPTYEEVSAGRTGHTEALQIRYDPAKVSYSKLLDVFWHNHDPVDPNGQFCDKGSQYRPGIFVMNAEERSLAEASKQALEEAGTLPGKIATEITDASTFYPAESYHQDYYLKNPIRYKYYRYACGRDKRLGQLFPGTENAGH